MTELARQVEALLFLSPESLPTDDLCALTGADPDAVADALAELRQRHSAGTGLEVTEVAGGHALRTRADLAAVCDRLRERPPDDSLSPAALETLAIVAYLQPITRPEISRLRGVASDAVVAGLVERGLLEESGRPASGGAMRYRATAAMQERFGLRDRHDLPPLDRFELAGEEAEAIRRRLVEAGHLEDSEPVDVW